MTAQATPGQRDRARRIADQFVWTPENGDRSKRTGPQQIAARAIEQGALTAILQSDQQQAERDEAFVEWAREAAATHHRLAAENRDHDELRLSSLSLSRAYGALADAIEAGSFREYQKGRSDG